MSSVPHLSGRHPILVLGGGISGLACAYYLSKLPGSVLRGQKIVLVEGQAVTGGWLQSERFADGVVHELGPRSIRTAGTVGLNTLSLVCIRAFVFDVLLSTTF